MVTTALNRMEQQGLVVLARSEIRTPKFGDDPIKDKVKSIHGHGFNGSRISPDATNDNQRLDDLMTLQKDLIRDLAESVKIDVNMRGDFETAIRNTIEAFQARQAEAVLPEKPLRDYRPRESIIDYLRSPEGFGPWVEAGALTRPLLGKLQPRAYTALANWLRTNELPADLPIPTKSEMVSAELGRAGSDLRIAARLAAAAGMRSLRQRQL